MKAGRLCFSGKDGKMNPEIQKEDFPWLKHCPASRAESLADACAVHGMPVDRVLEAINAKIAEAR